MNEFIRLMHFMQLIQKEMDSYSDVQIASLSNYISSRKCLRLQDDYEQMFVLMCLSIFKKMVI